MPSGVASEVARARVRTDTRTTRTSAVAGYFWTTDPEEASMLILAFLSSLDRPCACESLTLAVRKNTQLIGCEAQLQGV